MSESANCVKIFKIHVHQIYFAVTGIKVRISEIKIFPSLKEIFLDGQEGESIVCKQIKTLLPSLICFLLVYKGLMKQPKLQ